MNSFSLRHPWLVPVLLLGLAGCASVGPNYQPPDLQAPAHFNGQAALAARPASTQAPPLDQWWTGFHDPALTRLIERVQAQNLDLAAAEARIEAARAVLQRTRAQQLPAADLSADSTREHQSLESPLGKIAHALPGYQRDSTLYEADAGASWEWDLFGGLRRQTEAATAEAQAAEANRLGLRVSLTAEAADAYFRLRGAERRLRLAEARAATDSQWLTLTDLRVQDGLAAAHDRDLAQAQLADTRALIAPLRQEIATQMNRLDVLMGAYPGANAAQLAEPESEEAIPAIGAAGGPADLLRRRPDVIAAERQLAAANAEIGVAMAEYYPKVSLSALIGSASLGGGTLFTSASEQAAAAVGLRWRLFDFGRVNGEVAEAKGRNAEALARYRQAMLRATEDVEDAIVALIDNEALRQQRQQQVDARAAAYRKTQLATARGALSLYDQLLEQRQLQQAQDQLQQARTDNALAAVATFRALGGGW